MWGRAETDATVSGPLPDQRVALLPDRPIQVKRRAFGQLG